MADFTAPEIEKLKLQPPDLVVVFTRPHGRFHLLNNPIVQRFLTHEYGYQPEMPPDEIAKVLSMNVARTWTSRGLSFSLLTR